MRRFLSPLPLALVTAMVASGAAIEILGFGQLDWAAKLPLATLLAVAFARSRRAGGARDAG